MELLEQLASYNVVNNQRRLSLLNARPKVIPFQNTATPTAIGVTESAIITMGDRPWILNQIQLGSITDTDNTLPSNLPLQFNVYDSDNLGLFGGPVAPRASTVFGSGSFIPYAVQPVKVFPPRTKLKLEWTNRSITQILGFEMFFCGIEILDMGTAGKDDGQELRDALDELLYEKRTR